MKTSSAIQVFKGQDFSVRTVTDNNGETWFIAKDVAENLGYKNPQEAIREHVDEEDKGVSEMLTPGGKQQMPIINESGLYTLILSSKLPTAKQFKHWITSEVLPSIRKTGFYATPNKIDDILANPDSFISILQAYKAEKAKSQALSEQVAVQKQQIAELQPKANYYDIVLQCKDVLSISVISKDYGWTATRMNKFLHAEGIQFKQGGIWLLYQKYAEMGYTSTKTSIYTDRNGEEHSVPHTYWTQKGRLFIYHLMKSVGYLPLIEQEGKRK